MQAINITAYTEDASQIEAIKAVIKAFKIRYRISKMKDNELITQLKTDKQDEKSILIGEIKEAVENLKLVREGKLQARSAKDLLNEL